MIQDSVNRISYDGNGIATEFAYPFSITTTNDVKVMIVDANGTETILTNDYYVDEANSKVDYPGYPPGEEPLPELQPPVLATGQRIVIYRELDVTQLTSLFDQYPFKTIETMIDKTTILLQQLQDAQQRALTLSASTGTDVSLILPAPSALKSFRWNAAGTALELTADPATVLASVQGYTELAEGYATTANEKAGIATAGATTATQQASLAIEAAETMTLATQAEAEAGTDNVKRMSPLRVAQQTTARIASQAEAEAGTDTNKLMTPERSKQLVDVKTASPTEKLQTLGTLSANTTINCANGNIATATLGAAITIGITANASTSTCRVCTLILTNGGAYTITWNSAIKWAGGTAPTLTASGVDVLTFMTVNNGTTWYGALNGSAFA